jgi:hypothetical protein
MTVHTSQCTWCEHLELEEQAVGLPKWVCAAYPDGIPREIESNEVIHTAPHRQENGVLFTPTEEAKAAGYSPEPWPEEGE